MTEREFGQLQAVKDRIDTLEEEIYALLDGRGKRVNPFKPFSIRGYTKKHPYIPTETEITLSHEDINILLNVRERELSSLRQIIGEDQN